MLGIKELIKDREKLEKRLRAKDPEISLDRVIGVYQDHCQALTELEELRAELNSASKKIGEAKRRGEDITPLHEAMTSLKERIQQKTILTTELEAQNHDLLATLPNIPDEDIKESLDPKDNVCIKTWGEKPNFSFTPKHHLEIAEQYDLLDFKRAAKITGSGWPIYKGLGARLEWALLNLMIDTHQKNGFTFHLLPHLVTPEMMYGAGQLPKFGHQLFRVKDNDYDLYLIPTSEVALNGLHYDEILEESDLPKLYTSYTPCFRREAGAAGKAERGLIRIHQFNKVEMFCFTTPETSDQIFNKMMASAEEILEGLGLHYRNMLLVTGDMSFGAARTVDIEVWLPGQNRYYEVSSVSNCRDFQARRSKIRYKSKDGSNRFVHTLNGSGLATSRLFVALLENNQKSNGRVTIPKILQPYLGLEEL